MYAKWDKMVIDDDDDADDGSLASKFDPVAIAKAAEKRVEQAKAEGRKPNPLDVMASQSQVSSDASKALSQMSDSVKQRFLDRLNQPEVQKAFEHSNRHVDEAAPVEARAKDGSSALELVSKGILLVGKRVIVSGLKSQPELNGKLGQCMQYVEDKARCAVLLDGQDKAKLFKMENIEVDVRAGTSGGSS